MTKEEKNRIISELSGQISGTEILYLADTSQLNAETTSRLRRECFNKNIGIRVVKNTLLRKALETVEGRDFAGLYETLSGTTAILVSDTGNAPAKLIKEFRKGGERPILKAAYVQEAIFIGDNQLDTLVKLKSKNELIGDIIGLLQSPAKNVISALQSGGQTIAGIVKTLEDRKQ
jgi:large subunit ribosomal protein L10